MNKEIIKKFNANVVADMKFFIVNLNMENQHYYANRYPKAFDVCGYFNFSTIDDVESYMEKATDYIADAYKLDLGYSVRYYDEKKPNKGGVLRIYFDDDKLDCFIEGRFCEATTEVFSVA